MYKNIVVQDFHYVKLQQHNLYVNVGWSYQFLLSSKCIENIKLSYINFMNIAYVISPTFGRKILDKCNTYILLSLNICISIIMIFSQGFK